MQRILEFLLILTSWTWSLASHAQNRCDLAFQGSFAKSALEERQLILEEIHALQEEITKPSTTPELLPLLKKQYQIKIHEFEARFGNRPEIQKAAKGAQKTPDEDQQNRLPTLKKLHYELEHPAYITHYSEALDKLIFSGEKFTTIVDLSTGSQTKVEGTTERFSTETQKLVLVKKTNKVTELSFFDLKKMLIEPTKISTSSLLSHEGPRNFVVYMPSENTMNILDLRTMKNIYEDLENPGNFPLISDDGTRLIWKVNSEKTLIQNGSNKKTVGMVEVGSPDLEWIVYKQTSRSKRYNLMRLKDDKIVDLGEHSFGTRGSFSPDNKFFIYEDREVSSIAKVIRLSDLAKDEFKGQNPRIFDNGFLSYQVFNGPGISTLYLTQFGAAKSQVQTFSATQNFEIINGRFAYFYDGSQYILVDVHNSKEIGKLPFQPGDIKSFTSNIFVIDGWINAAILYGNSLQLDLQNNRDSGSQKLIPLPRFNAIFSFDSRSNTLQLTEYKTEM